MENIASILQQCGERRKLSAGDVLIRQGMESDGVYYLEEGRLGVYREEEDFVYLVAEITPGEMVGELGATTGRLRTATVRAEEESYLIHVSEADFQRALDETPELLAEVISIIGDRLTNADVVMVNLGLSYQRAVGRVQTLSTETERLTELLRLREELANMIIHDLRNPLGVVSSGLELLRHTSPSKSRAAYLAMVLEAMEWATRRMQRLVNTLLDIARLEAGEISLNLQPLSPYELIEEIVAEELPLARNNHVMLEARLDENLPQVMADRDAVQRVLANLLDNALRFTPPQGKIWIKADPAPEGVRIEVLNTGPTIPIEDRERIFEKFTRIPDHRGGERGMGLGLAFCRMAIEAHKGRIWVEDGPGGAGSRFVFVLPCAALTVCDR